MSVQATGQASVQASFLVEYGWGGQVIDGNYNRMPGVCPRWDVMKAQQKVS